MYTITPIACATFETNKGTLTYLVDQCLTVEIPVLSFLVESTQPNDDTAVLVDTGFKEPDENGEVHGNYLITGGGATPIRQTLEDCDLQPADVDYVVLTHLHHDHCSNNGLFSNAEIIVQQAELQAARDPDPHVARTYDDENTAELESLDVTVIDGDHSLRPGIDLWHVPGHTEGMQCVMVSTESGTFALVSDLAYCPHNLSPGDSSMVDTSGNLVPVTPQASEYILPGIHVDIDACYESIRRVRDHVQDDRYLLPSHSPELIGKSFP